MSSEPSDLMDFVLGFLWWIWWAPMARQRNGKIRCIQTDVVTSRPVMKRGASQIVVPFRCAPFCRRKKIHRSYSAIVNSPTRVRRTKGSLTPPSRFSLSSHSSSLSPRFWGGRAFGPPLCGGTPPATPPLKPRLTTGTSSSQHGTCREWRWLSTRHIMIKARMVSGMKG